MGEALLVKGGTLRCSHGGMLRLPAGDARLKAAGREVVTAGMEVGLSFAAGTPPCPFTTSAGASPCTATLSATAGTSAATRVGGKPVLLASAQGPATNVPMATWEVADAGQSVADSS